MADCPGVTLMDDEEHPCGSEKEFVIQNSIQQQEQLFLQRRVEFDALCGHNKDL